MVHPQVTAGQDGQVNYTLQKSAYGTNLYSCLDMREKEEMKGDICT